MKWLWLSVLLMLSGLFSCNHGSIESKNDQRPNIILILADDMGYSDIGCYGGEINTPNLDRLAGNGIRFTQFYNTAKCFPTRASLMTGLYSHQVGMGRQPGNFLKNCVTIAQVLRTAGYRTLMSGKWHGTDLPVNMGFDRYYGLVDGAVNYWNPGKQRAGEPVPGRKTNMYPRTWAIDSTVYKPYTPDDPDFYITDAFTDRALEYLETYKDEDNPYFLYLAYTAPHYPLHAWPEDIARYKGRYAGGYDSLRQWRFRKIQELGLFPEGIRLSPKDSEVPDWEDLENRQEEELKMEVYAAMVDRMDQNVGKILKKVEELGEWENTIIFFLSDNGACAEVAEFTPDIPPGPVESYRSLNLPWANATNTPFRKYKNHDFEGGICTPFIVHYPSLIQTPFITDQPGHLIDIMATCIDFAGAKYPGSFEGHEVLPFEGKSLLPALRRETGTGHEFLYWQWANSVGVRKGDWKAVGYVDSPWELYDLRNDRTELNDLAAEYPEIVKELDSLFNRWAKRTGARIRTFGTEQTGSE
ncbi:MAG: arylsulfatase [Cyclobacteriaceae bacterium]|nr:arylsulfatase [Cyclobacteriaceae bacterium]